MIRLKALLLLSIAVLLISSCDPYSRSTRKRIHRAAKSKGDIVLGIVPRSHYEPLLIRGVQLAVEELNKRGGVLGRRIKTITYDDEGSLSKGQKIAKKLAKNYDVIAVIGHSSSGVAIPVSIIYQRNGMVFISTGATNPALTQHNFGLVFRNIPSDKEFARQMAELAYSRGFRKMVIIQERSTYGEGLGGLLHEEAQNQAIEIVTRRSYVYLKDWPDFRLFISNIMDKEFDAIFLAGTLPSAAYLMKQARSMGVTAPFIGGDGLHHLKLSQIAGDAAEGTVVPCVFNVHHPDSITQDFVKRFKSRFDNAPPDTYGAQGYDAIKVLAFAIEKGGSAMPMTVSSNLRFIKGWKGVTGSYSFAPNGDIVNKKIFFKILRNGRFEHLEN